MRHDWKNLARHLRTRRGALHLTQREAADRAGISPRLWSRLERGTQDSYRTATLAAVTNAMGWTAGSINQVLGGGYPTLLEDADDIAELRVTIQRMAKQVDWLVQQQAGRDLRTDGEVDGPWSMDPGYWVGRP